jgi:hypothetical protein
MTVNKFCSRSVSAVVLILLIASAPLTMGAKWTGKPVQSLESITGKWKGSGIGGRGWRFDLEIVISQDGSMDTWYRGQNYSDKNQYPAGTLRINAGKLEYKNTRGAARTGVLQEDEKGRQVLKFHGDDGVKFDARPMKK